MGREDLHFRLRIPEALKERVRISAEKNNRSMTAEIVQALETAYPEPAFVHERFTHLLTLVKVLAAGGASTEMDAVIDELEDILDLVRTGSLEGLGDLDAYYILQAWEDLGFNVRDLRKRTRPHQQERLTEEEQAALEEFRDYNKYKKPHLTPPPILDLPEDDK